MSIATKRGDRGNTSLLSGERITKSDPQVEAYGVIDELNSWLGLARVKCEDADIKQIIFKVQKDLFIVAAELASLGREPKDKLKQEHLAFLEAELDSYQSDFNLSGFIVPGESEVGSLLDICRTICRRAERRTIAAEEEKDIEFSEILHSYINRLSDLIYILSRTADRRYLIDLITEKVCQVLNNEES
ncbi:MULTISPECIES: cob(I)yrinic acid a,c-diamide adenosyltransferase [unclassified Halanaerobium]|uniref:cob(I)yrinic acid a,c-diamide adenosyltransferase n=1 Tax=unclassified Halanaerobium TaxID=2641197 RepID=UPI000DF45C02|nr:MULTISPECIES: cob(I)yrinic acid a,c-diamide adenosyltransferase [unclassified Halanaerobium]RCW45660.1 cob(I)alamin adenosyltransferase [Halanaerobium sp. MA284_MarDTE_T2]RCW88032.1 cob(I)alamin adenosyltransferase [Halanaerobium sp. DL-01]